ncbi:hypothetical protein H8356DRAFT_1420177 [Neocallimastix lanati (nom. inval.)]|nr:hypothetical protein H8356DRAFT_1420177 [Neocallimastix sp. JGI-2020a]
MLWLQKLTSVLFGLRVLQIKLYTGIQHIKLNTVGKQKLTYKPPIIRSTRFGYLSARLAFLIDSGFSSYQLKFNLVIDKKFDKNNMKKNNDNSTNNGNIVLIFPLILYSLESYGRELQHMLKSTLLDN